MNFLDIPEGESIFIDANVFVYAFAADPTLGPPCRDLVERIGRKELEAYLSTSVFSEIAHRLMTLEACSTNDHNLRSLRKFWNPFSHAALSSCSVSACRAASNAVTLLRPTTVTW